MLYKADHTGKKPANQFREEIILDGTNKDTRIVILKHRPFFLDGLVVQKAGGDSPLTYGVDYKLTDEYSMLESYTETPVYGGIHFINPEISGRILIDGNHIGGTFYPGYAEELDRLVKYLNNPKHLPWPNVQERPTLYPPFQGAVAWSDLLNKDYVASAIRDLEINFEEEVALVEKELEKLTTLSNQLAADITALDYPKHQAEINPHKTNTTQLNIYDVNATVADTLLAYGKTFVELMESIRSKGLSYEDINKYLDHYCSLPVKGVWILPDGVTITTPTTSVTIVTMNDSLTVSTDRGIYVSAGMDETTGSRTIVWRVGSNELKLSSSGKELDHNSLTFNGYPLITFSTLKRYQTEEEATSKDGASVSSETITFKGTGESSSPIVGELKLPDATATVSGVAKLVDKAGTETVAVAVTPQSVKGIERDVSDYLPRTAMIGGRPLEGDGLVFTATDLGLGKVSNTADSKKPLSVSQREAIAGKSPLAHGHDWKDIDVPKATHQDYGVAALAKNVETLKSGKAVANSVLFSLKQMLDTIDSKLGDTDAKKIADYIYIGKQKWEVAPDGLSLTVRDLQYYGVKGGKSISGRLSNTVNLGTTPMFAWYDPRNNFDLSFPLSVKHTQIAPGSEVLKSAETISLAPNLYGDRSEITMCTKLRYISTIPSFYIRAYSHAKINMYINGEAYETGVSSIDQVYPVLADTVVTVALEVVSDDPSVPMTLAYEIVEGDIVVNSSVSNYTRLGKKEEFFNPYSARHLIYANLETGSVFSRGEPVAEEGVDLRYVLLFDVDVGDKGVRWNTFEVEPTVDVGVVSEVEQHAGIYNAHNVKPEDWILINNPLIKFGQFMDTKPQFKADNPLYRGSATCWKFGGGNGEMVAYHDVVGASPVQWVTPDNPNEGSLTVEGSLLFSVNDCKSPDEFKLGMYLCGVNHVNVRNVIALPIWGDAKKGVGTITFGEKSWQTELRISTDQIRREDHRDLSYTPTLFKNAEDTNQDDIQVQLRYRYIQSTGRIRLHIAMFKHGKLISAKESNYDITYRGTDFVYGTRFAFSISGSAASTLQVLPTLFPGGKDADIDRVNYYNGLFSSYLKSDSSPGTMEALVLPEGIATTSVLEPLSYYDGIDTRSGRIVTSGDVPLTLRTTTDLPFIMYKSQLVRSVFRTANAEEVGADFTGLKEPLVGNNIPLGLDETQSRYESGRMVSKKDWFLLTPPKAEELRFGSGTKISLFIKAGNKPILYSLDGTQLTAINEVKRGVWRVDATTPTNRAVGFIYTPSEDTVAPDFVAFVMFDKEIVELNVYRPSVGDNLVGYKTLYDLTPAWEEYVRNRILYETGKSRIL